MIKMKYHVKRTKLADETSNIREGTVRCSRTFPSQPAAQREADAWNTEGRYRDYPSTGWRAEVIEGRSPPLPPCAGCGHARRNHLNGTGLCIVRSCRMCLIYGEA